MRQAIVNLRGGRERGTHPGLILQRYLTDHPKPEEERRALLDAARRAAASESLGAMYLEAFARWERSFPRDDLHRSARLATTGRLIVGLGSENVLETGLRLHHTYGVPIIPGSALKGLASHYCHEVWGQRRDEAASEANKLFQRGDRHHHSMLFGTTDDGGVIAFDDAWIAPESVGTALCLDVITPHHPKWQINGDVPPTDFDSPKPISFLSVSGTFNVRLSWSGPASTPRDRAEAWTALTMKLLQEALAEWGVGGKTSSGYGRLVSAEARQTRRQSSSASTAKPVVLPKTRERVETQLLEERTKNGGWKAIHPRSGLSGPIQNNGDVPADKKAGDNLELIVAFVREREIAFVYPTPAEEARGQPAPNRGQRGPRRGGPRR